MAREIPYTQVIKETDYPQQDTATILRSFNFGELPWATWHTFTDTSWPLGGNQEAGAKAAHGFAQDMLDQFARHLTDEGITDINLVPHNERRREEVFELIRVGEPVMWRAIMVVPPSEPEEEETQEDRIARETAYYTEQAVSQVGGPIIGEAVKIGSTGVTTSEYTYDDDNGVYNGPTYTDFDIVLIKTPISR